MSARSALALGLPCSIRSRVVPRALIRLKNMHPDDFRALFDEEWEKETAS